MPYCADEYLKTERFKTMFVQHAKVCPVGLFCSLIVIFTFSISDWESIRLASRSQTSFRLRGQTLQQAFHPLGLWLLLPRTLRPDIPQGLLDQHDTEANHDSLLLCHLLPMCLRLQLLPLTLQIFLPLTSPHSQLVLQLLHKKHQYSGCLRYGRHLGYLRRRPRIRHLLLHLQAQRRPASSHQAQHRKSLHKRLVMLSRRHKSSIRRHRPRRTSLIILKAWPSFTITGLLKCNNEPPVRRRNPLRPKVPFALLHPPSLHQW